MGDILKAPSSKVSSIESSFSTYESNLKNALSNGESVSSSIKDAYLLYGWTKILNYLDAIINKKDKIKEWGTNYIDNLKTLESKLPETPGFSLSYSAISSETATRNASKPSLSTYKSDNRNGEIEKSEEEKGQEEAYNEAYENAYTEARSSGYSTSEAAEKATEAAKTASSEYTSSYAKKFNELKTSGVSDYEAAKEASTYAKSYAGRVNDYRNSGMSDYEAAKTAHEETKKTKESSTSSTEHVVRSYSSGQDFINSTQWNENGRSVWTNNPRVILNGRGAGNG